ncbi:MAG: hypothetical protein CXT77_02415 [uncultured DHVE6 group euryarchaeote]|jgi:hypothetical protein|nr:MAG: hypothetical protein CXT77_02415 [uncultured DHVE6 group euryarchaeote]
MVQRRKSKKDITKYVIIGIVVLVLLFLVMNVDPTGKFRDAPGQKEFIEEDFSPSEGMLMQEEDGSFLCYTFESRLTESCVVKDLDDFALPEELCSCFSEENFGPPEEEREEEPSEEPSEEPYSENIF